MKKEKNCPFCNIDLKRTRILDETKNTLVLISNPVLMDYHLLVIPKKHVEKLSELSEKERAELFNQVIKFEEKILKIFPGVDICQHYRPFQKQDGVKVNHLHVHIKPRRNKDELCVKSQIFENKIWRLLSPKELDKIQRGLK